MSAGEPIVLGSSSPPPAQIHDKGNTIVDSEYLESLKENLSLAPLLSVPLKAPVTPSAFPRSRPTTTGTFRIPEKFSPPRSPAHSAVAGARPPTKRDVAVTPAAKKPRLEASLGPASTKVSTKKRKQAKSARTVTRTVLDKYDALDKAVLDVPAPDVTAVPVAENVKPGSESPKKKKPSRAKPKARKAAQPAPPKLLDPETAHRKIERQGTFFGTSSQLTRAESLAEVRDLQLALQASEVCDFTGVVSGTGFAPDERSKMSGTRSLWAEGARGDGNFLLEPDPNAVRGATRVLADDSADVDHYISGDGSGAFVNYEGWRFGSDSHVRKSMLLCAETEVARSESDAVVTKSAKSMEKGPSGPGEAVPAVKRPRGRPRKNPAGTCGDPTGKAAEASTTMKVRKTTKARAAGAAVPIRTPSSEDSFANMDEIDDPDQEQRSTPKRGAGAKHVRLELSPSQEAQASEVCQEVVKKKKRKRKASKKAPPTDEQEIRDWEAEAPVLFGLITRAITTAGKRSASSMAKPSWREKMLLYDPICIEDLTDWLNGGPLAETCQQQDAASEVRWEGQVEAWKVKIWCEQHSVCCYNKDVVRDGRGRKG